MPETRTIAVTGASGFLGGALADLYRARGNPVIALKRSNGGTYDLRRSVEPRLFASVDTIFHAAYISADDAADAFDANVRGAQNLLAAARSAGVRRVVFLSSCSASPTGRSTYARQKHAIEELMRDAGHSIVRPGLVLGSGGLFQRMTAHLSRRRHVPLVSGGRQPVHTVHVDDFARACDAASSAAPATYYIAEPRPVRYADLMRAIAAHICRPISLVPMPGLLLRLAASAANHAGVRMPVSHDSIIGLSDLRVVDSQPSLEALGCDARSYLESLASLPRAPLDGAG